MSKISSEVHKLNYNLPLYEFLNELDEIDSAIQMAYAPQNKSMDKEHKYYPYIANRDVDDLVTTLFQCWERHNIDNKFLDVGCGTGRILALRKYLTGSDVIGVEINSTFARVGMEAYGVKIIIGDAFKVLTKEFLKSISYIYSYMPIAEPKLMRELEVQIEKNAKYGATRIEMLPHYMLGWDNFGSRSRERIAVFRIYPENRFS